MTYANRFLLIGLLALAACQVPSAEERRKLDSMIGRPTVDVIRTFGVPTRQFTTGDHTFLAYITQETDYTSMPMGGGWGYGPGWGGGWGGYGGWGYGGWGYGGWGGGMGTAYTYSCQTNFELVKALSSVGQCGATAARPHASC